MMMIVAERQRISIWLAFQPVVLIFELLEEISKDLKNYDLEFRIEQLESKFSKDMSESTFNEIRELKKQKNIN